MRFAIFPLHLSKVLRPHKTTSERPKVLRTPQFYHFWLPNVLRATTACTFSTSQLPKVVRAWCFFGTFDFEMCFAHLRATMACTLSTSQLSNVVRPWCALYILTSKCASPTKARLSTSQLPKVLQSWGALYILAWTCVSRHHGVQLFISHLTTWLRTLRFSEPTFRPSGATNHWKNTVFRDFPTFSRTWIFFLRRLSLFWSSFFFSSLLWLFPSLLFICPYCRKFDF